MILEELLARECIRKTLAKYTMAGDRLQVQEFVAVFTEDGVLESDGVPPPDDFRYQGRQQIGEWMSRWLQEAQQGSSVHEATFVRHHLGTCQIDITAADTAKVRTYWTAYTDLGLDHLGYYVDVFRKVGEEWLIAHRKIRLDWRSPNSLMFSAIANTRGRPLDAGQ